jgi:hypothetical protein
VPPPNRQFASRNNRPSSADRTGQSGGGAGAQTSPAPGESGIAESQPQGIDQILLVRQQGRLVKMPPVALVDSMRLLRRQFIHP